MKIYLLSYILWSLYTVFGLEDDLNKLLSLPIFSPDLMHDTSRYTCTNQPDESRKLNDFHLRGTALGGWLVLEPWITPSLFYQFLGASEK